jgi:hypothetical protein
MSQRNFVGCGAVEGTGFFDSVAQNGARLCGRCINCGFGAVPVVPDIVLHSVQQTVATQRAVIGR